MFALADRTNLYQDPTIAFIATRGSQNAKLIKGLLREGVSVYAWPQNDPSGEKWAKDLWNHTEYGVKSAKTAPQFGDLNDWIRADATALDLLGAIARAEVLRQGEEKPPPT